MRAPFLFAILFLMCGPAAGQTPLGFEREEVLSYAGDAVAVTKAGTFPSPANQTGEYRRVVRNYDSHEFIRVGIELVAAPASPDWSIEIRSTDDAEEHLADVHKLVAGAGPWEEDPAPVRAGHVMYSDEFAPRRAVLLVVSWKQPEAKPLLKMAAITLATLVSTAESIPDRKDELESFDAQPEQIRRWGAAVARLRFGGSTDGKVYYCTAFLVSANLIMTNYHCIQYPDEMETARVEFGADGPGAHPILRRISTLERRNRALDMAIFRLSEPMPVEPLRLATVPMTEPLPQQQHHLVMVQHPSGGWKQVSCKNCVVAGISLTGADPLKSTDFGHLCDTYTGSSGSPVQDATSGFVLGLHHLGVVDDVKVNRAVHSAAVLEYLQKNAPKLFTLLTQ